MLATETAEGTSEWLHRRLREEWGFPDPPTTTMYDRFTSRYRGKRYSFGYPACPNMDDKQGIWKLLRPEEIGGRLTEGRMMEPGASESALIFIIPTARTSRHTIQSPPGRTDSAYGVNGSCPRASYR